MYRPLFFLSLGAATAVVLALATAHELTRFRPEAELRRAFVAVAKAGTLREVSGFGWTEGTGDGRVVSTVYASGQIRGGADGVEHGTRFRLVRLGKERYSDVAGEWRSLGGKEYLTYEPPGPDVAGKPFTEPGSWLSFKPDAFAAWGPLFPGVKTPVEPLFDDQASPWAADTLLAARRLLAQADFSHVSFDGTFAQVNGHKTRVLDVRADQDTLASFLSGLVRAREGREPTDAERLRAVTLAKGLTRFTFRVWVGVTDHVPYRVQTAGVWTTVDGTQVPMDFLAELSALDAPFEVVAPPSSAPFRPLVGALPSADVRAGDHPLVPAPFTSPLPSVSFTPADDADQDGLDAVLETFYGTDPQDADTDGDGVTDGEEVRTGRNPRGTGTLFGFGLGRP